MMNDPISRKWLLSEINHDLGCFDLEPEKMDAVFVDLRDVVRMILAAPPIDAAPVVLGGWLYWGSENGRPLIRCSKCGAPRHEDYAVYEFNYCPNCGASMDEDVWLKCRDPKTGEVFRDILAAYEVLCAETDGCDACPLSSQNNGRDMDCNDFADHEPAEAARLMGYELTWG